MSALSQEVPLLPVLVPQPDAPEQAGGGPVSAERLAALRRSLVAAMAAYTRDGGWRAGGRAGERRRGTGGASGGWLLLEACRSGRGRGDTLYRVSY